MKLLFSILKQKRYFWTAVIVLALYFFIYNAATQQLVYTQRLGESESFFALKISSRWPELLFKQRAPFLYEPIGAIYLGPNLKFLISIPNIALALLLGVLVGVNLALSYYSFHALSLRGTRGALTLLGTVPSILSGIVCCVPTLILVIGLQFTAVLATAWSFFVPLSIILLITSLWWSLSKIKTGTL